MSAEIKVTDKRIFTEDGELREEYKHLGETESPPTASPTDPESSATSKTSTREATRETSSVPADKPPGEAAGSVAASGLNPQEAESHPTDTDPPREASFFAIVASLAEPIALFLGDIDLPDGRSAEDLERARLHIDLLAILQDRTSGNLSEQESRVLEDVIYRLRMRYVQKTKG